MALPYLLEEWFFSLGMAPEVFARGAAPSPNSNKIFWTGAYSGGR